MSILSTALLWSVAVLTVLAQRAWPLLVAFLLVLWERPTTHPLLPPAPAQQPLDLERLHQLTRRELQEAAGTRRHLSKAQLIEMALARS